MSPVPASERATVAIREFARLDGCSPKRVRNARETGHLEFGADGRPYVDQAGGEWREGNRKGGDTIAESGEASSGTATLAAPDAAPEDIVASADAFAADVLAGRFRSRRQAEEIKENALALRQVLEVRKLAGELVSRAAVVDATFKAVRAERDTFLAWPGRVAPLLAADLGAEPGTVNELLTAHVHDLLTQLGTAELDLDDRK